MVKLPKSVVARGLVSLVVVSTVVASTQQSLPAILPISSTLSYQQLPIPKPLKVVFFGSSTTVGFGTTRGDRRWTTLLSKYLGWQEVNEGLSGSTISTGNWPGKPKSLASGLERWRSNVLSRHPDRVVMLYGVNDIFRQIPLGQTDQLGTYNGDLNKMLTDMAKEFRPDQLINISSQPNQATLERRAPYDVSLLAVTTKVGGYFIDGQAAFPVADLPGYAADGLHLNDLGHAAFASFLANKMVELGLELAPPNVPGGNQLTGQLQPLPGKTLLIDQLKPLAFGRLKTIEAQWVGSGQARLAVVRPTGRGDYELLYRTPLLTVNQGMSRVAVPNWWVLEGDRLAIWSDHSCIGGSPLAASSIGHWAVPDLTPTVGQSMPQAIAIRAVN
jgi:lysophospholipase L1-like esterase